MRLLPLGSVVELKNNQKMMIFSRAMYVTMESQKYFFDYGGCFFPEGMISGQAIYFNQTDIAKVIHTGYESVKDQCARDEIQQWMEDNGVKRHYYMRNCNGEY